jgi:hypothetical protein
LVGNSSNSYAAPIGFDYCLLSGKKHRFEWPNGTEYPTWNAIRDVLGCGLLLSRENEMSIFFTLNGILLGEFFLGNMEFPFTILQANKFQSAQLLTFSFQL